MKNQFYERYWQHKDMLGDFSYKWPTLKKLLPADQPLRFLDFGCGTGYILQKIMKGHRLYFPFGVDVSPKALSVAKKRIPTGTFKLIDESQKIHFPAGYFDFVLASDVLEHIYDTETAFSELARVAKKGGKILVTLPYNGKLKVILATLLSFDQYFDPYSAHIRFFSPGSLASCLRRVGLRPEQRGYYGRFYPFSNGMYVIAVKT